MVFDKALAFAKEKHKGQVRRYSCRAGVTHPINVANKLKKDLTVTEEVIAAAYLHDTLEDTNTTEEEISSLFGDRVLDLVRQVTAPDNCEGKSKSQFWNDRVLKMDSDGMLLKLTDRLMNMRELNNTRKEVNSFFKKNVRETKALVNTILEKKGEELTLSHNRIIREITQVGHYSRTREGLLEGGGI